MSRRRRAQGRSPWIDWLAIPAMVLMAAVVGYPIVRTLVLSLFHYSLTTGAGGSKFVGFSNFVQLAQDPVFLTSVWNTVLFAGISLIAAVVFGLILALATENLNGPWKILRGFLMTPWAVPIIVTAFLFQFLFLDRGGIINELLLGAHLIASPIPWLTSGGWALFSVIVANVWQSAPFFLLVFTAGLRSVPDSVLESARIDRAPRWSVTLNIKLPYLLGPGVIAAVIMLLQYVNQFPLIWAMTGGGPGYSTTTIAIYIYQLVFVQNNLGYGSAIGVAWLVVVIVIGALMLRKRKDRIS